MEGRAFEMDFTAVRCRLLASPTPTGCDRCRVSASRRTRTNPL